MLSLEEVLQSKLQENFRLANALDTAQKQQRAWTEERAALRVQLGIGEGQSLMEGVKALQVRVMQFRKWKANAEDYLTLLEDIGKTLRRELYLNDGHTKLAITDVVAMVVLELARLRGVAATSAVDKAELENWRRGRYVVGRGTVVGPVGHGVDLLQELDGVKLLNQTLQATVGELRERAEKAEKAVGSGPTRAEAWSMWLGFVREKNRYAAFWQWLSPLLRTEEIVDHGKAEGEEGEKQPGPERPLSMGSEKEITAETAMPHSSGEERPHFTRMDYFMEHY